MTMPSCERTKNDNKRHDGVREHPCDCLPVFATPRSVQFTQSTYVALVGGYLGPAVDQTLEATELLVQVEELQATQPQDDHSVSH